MSKNKTSTRPYKESEASLEHTEVIALFIKALKL